MLETTNSNILFMDLLSLWISYMFSTKDHNSNLFRAQYFLNIHFLIFFLCAIPVVFIADALKLAWLWVLNVFLHSSD